ncbi:hypothetical protein MAC_04801 [Metarhizium acridum CQMa 102]|uniref:Cellulosomal scaffoldin anchoring protein C n=1 Tax=Metarhizium acridum (strain CQMa 102) TaxID=655827 RepID=E9E4K3_METAQ|nr:uncharacterized protein MAC_04801 [Metarhizium acridum CQMa 102]EFY89214.1 hypothetical protein MAC_04801 [Metarhizium acridum CQMa 102]
MESIELDHQQLIEMNMAGFPDTVEARASLGGPLYSSDATTSSSSLVSNETSVFGEESNYQTSIEETPIKEENFIKEETPLKEIPLKDTPLEEASEEETSEEEASGDDDDSDDEDKLFTKDNRCLRCLKICSYNNRADHRRAHGLPSSESEDEMFTQDNRCLRCLKSCAYNNRADHRRAHGLPSSESEDEMFTQDNRCLRCLKSCAYNTRADHRRVHSLQGSEGVTVPNTKRCTCCAIRGEQCIVAKEPCRKGLNTIRCLKCISNHRSCSFKKTFKRLRVSSLQYHPARLA